MNINRNNPDNWNRDIERSVAYYNNWFMNFAPSTFRRARQSAIDKVEVALGLIKSMIDLDEELLVQNPAVLTVLRQMTCPPLACERLAGLAGVPLSVVKGFELGKAKLATKVEYAARIVDVIREMLDTDLFSWIDADKAPTKAQRELATMVFSDRLCGALADPLIRNEQERRQLRAIVGFVEDKGYVEAKPKTYRDLKPGEYAIHLNIDVNVGTRQIKIPGDVSILPLSGKQGDMPILIEAKSAGDYTNVNKRRKEEATKVRQLKASYGDARFILFLGGYFDSGYLGFEAAEGIDWIWEHRINDMEMLWL